jgi:hypothetical protein
MSERKKPEKDEAPAMPFNDALKRVWAAKPMPKVKPKDGNGPVPKVPGRRSPSGTVE